MATTTPRRMLVFKIQKRLLALSISQLQIVASAIVDGSGLDTEGLTTLNEPELFVLIVDYLKSENLKGMKDEGMSPILHLDDMLDQLLPRMEKMLQEELTREERVRLDPSRWRISRLVNVAARGQHPWTATCGIHSGKVTFTLFNPPQRH